MGFGTIVGYKAAVNPMLPFGSLSLVYTINSKVDFICGGSTMPYEGIGLNAGLRIYPYNKFKWVPFVGFEYSSFVGSVVFFEGDNNLDSRYKMQENKFLASEIGICREFTSDDSTNLFRRIRMLIGINYNYSLTRKGIILISGPARYKEEKAMNNIVNGGFVLFIGLNFYFGKKQ